MTGNLVLIFTNRSWSRTILQTLQSKNRSMWVIVSGTIVALALVLYVPLLRNLFHFSVVHPRDVLIAVSAGLLGVLWFEALKLVSGHGQRKPKPREAAQ